MNREHKKSPVTAGTVTGGTMIKDHRENTSIISQVNAICKGVMLCQERCQDIGLCCRQRFAMTPG